MTSHKKTSILQLSDLHLEYDSKLQDFSLVMPSKVADIVVLTGDIAGGTHALPFIKYLLSLGYKVIYILGNHEFYYQNMVNLINQWNSISENLDNFYFLNNNSVVVDGIDFFGSTLWTSFGTSHQDEEISFANLRQQTATRCIELIPNMSPTVWKVLHYQARYALQQWLDTSTSDKKVVLTHYLPSNLSSAERFRGNPSNILFLTELGNLIAYSDIKFWFHGHTHDSFDYYIGETNIVCNPRGYVEKNQVNPEFSWNSIIKYI